MRAPLLAIALLGACSSSPSAPVFDDAVSAVVRAPDSVELFALHPYPHQPEGTPDGGDDLHGYRVLASAPLSDEGEIDSLVAAIERGIRKSDGTVAACFNPRHGVRFVRGADTVELVICYECLSMHVHGPGGARGSELTVREVQRDVDRVFRGVGLEIHRDS